MKWRGLVTVLRIGTKREKKSEKEEGQKKGEGTRGGAAAKTPAVGLGTREERHRAVFSGNFEKKKPADSRQLFWPSCCSRSRFAADPQVITRRSRGVEPLCQPRQSQTRPATDQRPFRFSVLIPFAATLLWTLVFFYSLSLLLFLYFYILLYSTAQANTRWGRLGPGGWRRKEGGGGGGGGGGRRTLH